MAIKLLTVNNVYNIREAKYIVDEESEKNLIPDEDKVQGTRVLVISGSKEYRMDSAGNWIEITTSGGESDGVEVKSLSVTENGTYTAEKGKAYSPVSVAVENTYAAGDEGKVVSNGALVAQTSDSVTENGTVDTTLISSLEVNVPQSSSSVKITLIAERQFESTHGESYIQNVEMAYPEYYDGRNATVVYDGTSYTAPMFYDATYTKLRIGEWDTSKSSYDFSNIPIGVSIDPEWSAAIINIADEETAEHTIKVTVLEENIAPYGLFTITENGTYDIHEYAGVKVNVDKPSVQLTISNTLSIPIFIIGLEDSGISRSVRAGGTSTYTCYGKYSTVFDRMLKIVSQTQYDFSNVNVSKSGASAAYKKYTNSTSPTSIIIDIHESTAQDFTIIVSESSES